MFLINHREGLVLLTKFI